MDVNGRKEEYRELQFDGMSNIGFQYVKHSILI